MNVFYLKFENVVFCYFSVYDQIIPVVDYTNLFILGVTTALAWELPDSPTYMDEKLQEQYKNGTLPLLNRNDINITDESNTNSDIIWYNANDELNRNYIESNKGQTFKDDYYFNRRFFVRPVTYCILLFFFLSNYISFESQKLF